MAGIEPTQVVSVVATVPLAEGSIQLIYRTPDGAMKERLLSRADEERPLVSCQPHSIALRLSSPGDLTCSLSSAPDRSVAARRRYVVSSPHSSGTIAVA